MISRTLNRLAAILQLPLILMVSIVWGNGSSFEPFTLSLAILLSAGFSAFVFNPIEVQKRNPEQMKAQIGAFLGIVWALACASFGAIGVGIVLLFGAILTFRKQVGDVVISPSPGSSPQFWSMRRKIFCGLWVLLSVAAMSTPFKADIPFYLKVIYRFSAVALFMSPIWAVLAFIDLKQTSKQSLGATSGSASSLNIHVDELVVPSFDVRSSEPSVSEPGRSYLVDLEHQTCECPDFTLKRCEFKKGSLARFCKHMLAVAHRSASESGDALIAAVSHHCLSEPISRADVAVLRPDRFQFVIIAEVARPKWIKFVFPKIGRRGELLSQAFFWAIVERRWGRGKVPENSAICEEIIAAFEKRVA